MNRYPKKVIFSQRLILAEILSEINKSNKRKHLEC